MEGIYVLYKMTYLNYYRQKYTSRKMPDAYDDEKNVRYEYEYVYSLIFEIKKMKASRKIK